MQKLTSTQCQSVRNTAKTPVEVQKEKNYYNFEKKQEYPNEKKVNHASKHLQEMKRKKKGRKEHTLNEIWDWQKQEEKTIANGKQRNPRQLQQYQQQQQQQQ